MNKKKRIDTESDEYLTWKQGSVPVEQPPEPIKSEPIIEESPELKRRKIFFLDWFFGITTHKGQMKMMYYFFTFFFYYLFCVVMVYDIEERPELNIGSIIFLAFLAIFVALALPFVLLIMGFTISGGIFIGMFVGIFSWLFGVGGRFLYKLFGYDMELLFPEFIGKKGEITKYSIFKYSAYPYAATISKMGLPGDSFLYKNNFSVRSDEELKIGMKIEVIKHEKWSITSLMKNHPTFVVRILDEEIMVGNSEINNLNK
jgi:hypothetical protein